VRVSTLTGVEAEPAGAEGEDLQQAAGDRNVLEEMDELVVATPFETLHPNYTFGRMQHEGDLSFKDGAADYEAIKVASAKVPTIVSVYLDQPAILGNVRDKAAALIGDFGASDEALLKALVGQAPPQGRLPFELASSMAAVNAQAEDAPQDSLDPLYPLHFGLTY
jgi:beta-glucosidase